MTWKVGVSGNPAGRKPGIIDKRQRIAQAFEADGTAIAQVVIEAAKKGDMQAATLVLSRLSSPMKPRAERVKFALDVNAPLATQAAQVVQAVANGDIDAESAQTVLACISTYAALVQADELEARLTRLEAGGTSRRPAGGIVEFAL